MTAFQNEVDGIISTRPWCMICHRAQVLSALIIGFTTAYKENTTMFPLKVKKLKFIPHK